MLNKLWPVLIIIAYSYGILSGKAENITESIFTSVSDAVELCIALLGTVCLWNGIMKITARTRIINGLKKLLRPILKRLFPEIPEDSKAYEEISMNMVANIMGLGNAATPLGLKAMESMQKMNDKKDTLSSAMMMFIVINTASLQIIPTTVIGIRSSLRK